MCRSSSNGLPLASQVAPSWSVQKRSPAALNARDTVKRRPVQIASRFFPSGEIFKIVPRSLRISYSDFDVLVFTRYAPDQLSQPRPKKMLPLVSAAIPTLSKSEPALPTGG